MQRQNPATEGIEIPEVTRGVMKVGMSEMKVENRAIFP
jgi:hypothetical protein